MNNLDVLYTPFDVEIHKREFVNYLEVVILEDGTVEYAVPSHELKLTNILMERNGMTIEEVRDLYRNSDHSSILNYLSPIDWFCKETRCISVWNDFYKGNPNEKQLQSLQNLKNHGLYYGEIYK